MGKNNTDIKEQIKKLEKGINHCSKKWEKAKDKMRWYSTEDPPVNVVILRNFTYVRNVVRKINENLDYIKGKSNSELSKEEKTDIDGKFISSYVMLESLLKINDHYSVVEFDYEVLNLKMFENAKYGNFKDSSIAKMALKNKKSIVENFESCKVKVVEGFGFLDPITDIINEIVNGFKMVIKGMIDIAKFIGNLLKDFVLMLFELLKMLYYFIVKIIPAIFTFFVYIGTGIAKRAHLIPFTLFLFFGILAAYFFHVVCIEGNCDQASAMNAKEKMFRIAAVSLVVTIGMWWSDNGSIMKKAQDMFVEGVLWVLRGPGVWSVKMMLGTSKQEDGKDHRIFRGKPLDVVSKIAEYIIFRAPLLIVRVLVIIAVIRFSILFFYPHFVSMLPSLREVSIVPFVALSDILKLLGIGKFMSTTAVVAAGKAAYNGDSIKDAVLEAVEEESKVLAEAAIQEGSSVKSTILGAAANVAADVVVASAKAAVKGESIAEAATDAALGTAEDMVEEYSE